MKETPSIRAPRVVHAEPPAHAPNAAMLIDFDNVTLAIRSDLSNQLRKLLSSDIFKGKVSVQRAYADWRRYPQYIVPLSEASIDLIFAPAFGSNKKNATDIRLAIDALELVFTRQEIGTFILLSGDSDFSSLVLKLKEYGKYVIGVGIRESSSDLLVQNCDEYFSYSELTGLTRQADVEYQRRDPWELVIEAVTQMKSEGDVMRSDRLKQVMQEIDPAFNEKDAGFSRFSKFVNEAGQRGLLRLTKLDNGQYEVDLGTNANVPVGGSVEEPSSRPRRQPRRPAARPSERAAGSGAMTLAAAFALIKETLLELDGVAHEVEAQLLRDRMIARAGSAENPIFERSRFQRLLRQAHDANVVELAKAEEGRYALRLNPAALAAPEPEPESDAGGPADTDAESDGMRRRRRGRRGGRGRGGSRRDEPSADSVEPQQDIQATAPRVDIPPAERMPQVPTGGTPLGAPRNPRFRHGSRGPVRQAPASDVQPGAEREPHRPEAAPPRAAEPLAASARSLRPRSGSRGRLSAAPVRNADPERPREPIPEPPAPAMPRPEIRARPPAPALRKSDQPSSDEEPSLLKRMTAALQRAVRGSGEGKPPDE